MELSFSSFLIFSLLILNALNIRGDFNYYVNKENWIDPDPLGRIFKEIDSRTTMEKEARYAAQARNEGDVVAPEGRFGILSPSDSSQHSSSSTTHPEEKNLYTTIEQQECLRSRLYMTRFINVLLRVSQFGEDVQRNLDVQLSITVTPEQLKVLQQFGKGSNDVSLQDLDNVLSSVLFSSTHIFEDDIDWSSVTDFLPSRELLTKLVLGCIFMFLMWKVLSGHSVYRIMMIILVLSFVISFFLTYHRMYKQAEIKHYTTVKANPEPPPSCRPFSDRTWAETFKQLYYRYDCQEYHEAVMIDPGLEVTPFLVLCEMLTSFFLHPFGKLGSAIAEFSNNVLGDLPFGVNYLVLFASYFFITIIICASFGGAMKLPFYLGGIELSGRRHQEATTVQPQISQTAGQGGQLLGHSVQNDTVCSLIQAAASKDTGLVIMDVHGIQKLMSGGNTAMVHRDAIEELQVPSSEKHVHCIHEKIDDQLGSRDTTQVSGCCGESHSGCHCSMEVDEAVATMRQLPEQPLRKILREELHLRKKVILSKSEVKHIQIQHSEVVIEGTGGVQENVLASADEKEPAFGTGHSSAIWETNIEDNVNSRRSDNSDNSDDDISFVIV